MTKELDGRLSSPLGLGLLLGPLERSIGIARELLAGRPAALFGTRWSGLH